MPDRRHRHVVVSTAVAVVLAVIPLIGATTSRRDGRSVLDTYLASILAVAAIQIGALVWLGWEIARHRRLGHPVEGRHPAVTGASAAPSD